MNSDLRRIGVVLLMLAFVLAGPVERAVGQNTAPRVLAYIQETKESPSLLVALSPAQPGTFTLVAARSDTYPFPLLSPNAKWMVSTVSAEKGDSYIYKPVGTAEGKGKTFATVKSTDEQQAEIDCCIFSDDSRFLLFLRVLPFSEYSKKWSLNIMELATGVQTTFWTTERRLRRKGLYGPEVMTELTEIIRVWRTADKRILFRKYIRFDERDDYPQNLPIGFYALDLSKFDLSKGGTFQMPPMVEFSKANFSADPFSQPEFHPNVLTNGPYIAPDTTQLAYTYGFYGIYVPIGIGILDLRTAKFTEVPIGTDSPLTLYWTSDSKKLVYISAKKDAVNYDYRDYRLNVLDVASVKVVQSVLIDAEGKMRWVSAFVCGDTVFTTAFLKTPPEATQTTILFSAPLTDPARYTQLFTAASIVLQRCA